MVDSFYSEAELAQLGLRACGRRVKISRLASIHQPASLSVGDDSRIDDFCLLTGEIEIGRHVHVGAYTALYGARGIVLEAFSSLSARVTLYTESDDYAFGLGLTNPTVPQGFRHTLDHGPIRLERHAMVGCGTVILPATNISAGTTVGALSLVRGDTEPWFIYAGVPATRRAPRKKSIILELEARLLALEEENG